MCVCVFVYAFTHVGACVCVCCLHGGSTKQKNRQVLLCDTATWVNRSADPGCNCCRRISSASRACVCACVHLRARQGHGRATRACACVRGTGGTDVLFHSLIPHQHASEDVSAADWKCAPFARREGAMFPPPRLRRRSFQKHLRAVVLHYRLSRSYPF